MDSATQNNDDSWTVILLAKIGPLARSKKLRMIQTESSTLDDGSHSVKFERSEVGDKAEYATWKFSAEVFEVQGERSTCEVDIYLEYGGSLWNDNLGFILDKYISRSIDSLAQVSNSQP